MDKKIIKYIFYTFFLVLLFTQNVYAIESGFCEFNEVKRILKIIGYLLLLIKIIVPLLLIIFTMLDLTKAMTAKDEFEYKKMTKIILKRVIAAILVFLVPTFINIILNVADDGKINDSVSDCKACLNNPFTCSTKGGTTLPDKPDMNNNSNSSGGSTKSQGYNWVYKNNNLYYTDQNGSIIKNKTFKINGVTYKAGSDGIITPNISNPYKTNAFPSEVNAIINAHRYDFDVNTFNKVISAYGGYTKYVKSLGGIFTKYGGVRNAKIKTEKEFGELADYVWGMMNMYGFEYSNHSASGKHWGGSKIADDGFYYPKRNDSSYMKKIKSTTNVAYPGSPKDSKTYAKVLPLSIEDVLAGNGQAMAIQCTGGVTLLFKKTGLIPQDGYSMEYEFYPYYTNPKEKRYYRQKMNAKMTKNMPTSQMKVGDVIGFFNGNSYEHVAVVGKADSNSITVYDSGSAKFTKKRSGTFKVKRNENILSNYGYSNYVVMRLPLNLK